MASDSIPTDWHRHRNAANFYYLRYPSEWIEVHPRSPSATFAAESPDRRMLFEVLSFTDHGANENLLELGEELLRRSLAEDFEGFRLEERGGVSLEAVDDDGIDTASALAWDLMRPDGARRMLCRMFDGIPCVQETWTLVRGPHFLHLNFKVAEAHHEEMAPLFRRVARSTYVGTDMG